MIIGVDRSHHNTPIPLKQLTAKGIEFIFFKCCQGTTIKDSAFEASWKEAKATPGLFRGAYHFFDPRLDGIAQANYFLSMNINFLAEYCLPPVVDIEDLVVYDQHGKVDKGKTDAANKWVSDNWKVCLQRFIDFLNTIKQHTTRDCIIYTYNNYMVEYYRSHPFPNNQFWLSSLQDHFPNRYDTHTQPLFWQNSYNWNGTDMDGNVFMGSMDDLKKWGNAI